jgi:hypothetical protein
VKRTIYRDRATGRFVKKSTWTRSHAQNGTRYILQRFTVEPRPAGEEPIERKPISTIDELEDFMEESDGETEDIEFEGAFDSP